VHGSVAGAGNCHVGRCWKSLHHQLGLRLARESLMHQMDFVNLPMRHPGVLLLVDLDDRGVRIAFLGRKLELRQCFMRNETICFTS
jgi:hypothetical protein